MSTKPFQPASSTLLEPISALLSKTAITMAITVSAMTMANTSDISAQPRCRAAAGRPGAAGAPATEVL